MRKLYGMILLLFLSFLVAACSNATSDENKKDSEQPQTRQENNDAKQEESPNLIVDPEDEQKANENETNEKPEFHAEKIMNDYKTTFLSLAQEAENDGELTSIETKEQLMSHLNQTMSQKLAKTYADTYFNVESNGVYIKAMDSPTWLEPNKSFEIKKINDNEYEVIQERNNELLGHVNISYRIVFNGQNWVVDGIQTKKVESDTKPTLKNEGKTDLISKTDAEEFVRDHLGIQNDQGMKVRVDHQESNKYVVHVYEVVEQDNNSHTATYGWYYVDKKNGKIENMMK
ncbi:hypothetical protein [Metabacillus litoralis]|uniref:hypothetical protein n=1 Tax=Metabacillus litoralis TaxID=152268 RepID=UPI001CFCEEA6|nr:hypothetical protein [Metabacillus litoralis]